MPVCIYCGAQTMNFVVLPTLSSASIHPWLTTFKLDAGKLSSDENVICSSHVEDLRVDQANRSDPLENNRSTFVSLGDSEQDERFQLALSSMRSVSLKEEVPTEFGFPGSTFKDPDQSRSRPGPSGSKMQSSALPTPPVTPTQVCDVTSSTPSSGSDVQDCPICLQPPQLPIKLPCNHIFCYLCAKGFASRIGRCAYCRTEIPPDFMRSPTVVPRDTEENQSSPSKYYWYYAGGDGWWQFEERHCQELEEALSKGDSQHELQVSGFIYVIDLVQMVQYRRDRPGRTRRIKRDIVNAPRKGVAGLRDNLINGTSM